MYFSTASRVICRRATNSFHLPTRISVAKFSNAPKSDKFSALQEKVTLANKIMEQEPGIKDVRQLLDKKQRDPEFREALEFIESNRELYLRQNLLLNYIANKPYKEPVRVAVTGASGAIGYAILFRIASGEMLGKDQPVHLSLLELPQAMNSLKGVVMELQDCAFPLLSGITATDDAAKAFDAVNYALLIGARPRGKGMERADLLKANAAIFAAQGQALSKHANPVDLKVVVVGNPANTNAYIAANNAKNIDPKCFTAMTRLDHNRGLAQLSEKLSTPVTSIKKFAIWGNHSSTQYPDISHTQVNEKWAKNLLEASWVKDTFIPVVQQRGAAIIAARGSSSAASAASSCIDHIRDWVHGSKGEWTSMAVYSDKSYGTSEGLYFSFPVTCEKGDYSIVKNVPIDQFSAEKIEASHKELLSERDAVKEYLPR